MHRNVSTELKVCIPCILPQSIASVPNSQMNSQINAFFLSAKGGQEKKAFIYTTNVPDDILLIKS